MEDINKITGLIRALENLNLIEVKASDYQPEILAHKFLTGQEVRL